VPIDTETLVDTAVPIVAALVVVVVVALLALRLAAFANGRLAKS
jgi:hypothetical protein